MQNGEQTEGRDEEKDRQNKPSTTQSSLAQDFRLVLKAKISIIRVCPSVRN